MSNTISNRSLALHQELEGKIEVISRKKITDKMKIQAAYAIAGIIPEDEMC